MSFYKTVFTFEVLSEGKLPDEMTLEDLAYATMQGHCSGLFAPTEILGPLTKETLIKECHRHNTDPGFFLEDDDE